MCVKIVSTLKWYNKHEFVTSMAIFPEKLIVEKINVTQNTVIEQVL